MRIAICDDDNTMLCLLKEKIVKAFEDLDIEHSAEVFDSGEDFIISYNDEPFDVVFLDIDMPAISGFDVAERINTFGKTLIIFVTSHDELVYSSFKFQPFRFLRKDHLDSELPEAVSAFAKILYKHTAAGNFEVHTSAGEVFLDLNEVEYIEIYGHWLKITVRNGEPIECYGSLSEFEKKLQPFGFVRTHKSYLVNCKFIYSVGQKQIILDDKTEIPLSRYKTENIKNALKSYLRSNL